MALVNDHPNETNYLSKQNSSSSEDLSSPGLDQPDAAYAGGGGGGSASSSSTMNSDHQQHQGFVFYPSGEDPHNSLMDFNGSSFLNFDHHESFPPPAISCGGNSGAGGFSFLEGNNMSYGFTNWNHQHHMDIISPRSTETPQGQKDWLYSDSTVVTTGSRHESMSPKSAGNKRSHTVITNIKDF